MASNIYLWHMPEVKSKLWWCSQMWNLWIHGKCNGLTIEDCKHLKLNNEAFFCKICTIHLFPFSFLNQELHAVAEWMKSNRLALSILKTNLVLFHSKRLKPYKSLNLKIDGVNIQEVSTVKYLGVTFDSNLTWKNHVNELCLKLSKTVGIFSKLRYYVNVDILIMLYYSLIYPFLTYGIQVWGLTYPTYLKPVTTL